jgi:L-lactate dehydrogenase complex protein LldG
MSSRDTVLARIRTATAASATATEPETVERAYLSAHVPEDPDSLVDLLAENLADYRAQVHRCTEAELPALIARLLGERGSRSVVVPPGLPPEWLGRSAVRQLPDAGGALSVEKLDAADSVLTGCLLAIAETGTIMLDAGQGQGRRALTLLPDHHVCVVRAPGQVVASLPRALPLIDPRRPLTWISGPSATSDIELDRVEGVHGPRTLEVVLVGPVE